MIDLIERHGEWLTERHRRVQQGRRDVRFLPPEVRAEIVRQKRAEYIDALGEAYRQSQQATQPRLAVCDACGLRCACWGQTPLCVACGGLP